MANSFTSVIPTILNQCLPVLRQNAVLVRLSNMDYGTDAQEKGNTITIGKSVAATVRDVAPGVTPAANQDITPTSTSLVLNKWKEATHNLTDKEAREIMDGFLPKQVEECVKALVNQIEADWLAEALYSGEAVGTAGTTPFATNINAVASCGVILNTRLAPLDDRFVVLDPAAEGNAKTVADVLRFDGAGPDLTQIRGVMGRRFGMDWFMDQNINSHTVGTAWVTGWSIATGGAALAATTLTIINATASGTILVGDLFTVGGGSQKYSIQAAVTVTSSSGAGVNTAITIYPALATAASSGAAATVIASYVQNCVFQRNALAFASRPLAPAMGVPDNTGRIVDRVSGIALTAEITREHYQSTFRVSCLYGLKLVRPDFLVHLLG